MSPILLIASDTPTSTLLLSTRWRLCGRLESFFAAILTLPSTAVAAYVLASQAIPSIAVITTASLGAVAEAPLEPLLAPQPTSASARRGTAASARNFIG